MKKNIINGVISVIVLFCVSSVYAHNKVVVVPLGGDVADLLERTVFVTGGDIDTHNGNDLIAALAFVNTKAPTTNNPWLIKLEPGRFDIGITQLSLTDGINIEGSGQGLSHILGATGQSIIYVDSQSTSISRLSVENTNGNGAVVSGHANSNFRILDSDIITNGIVAIQTSIPFSGAVGSGELDILGTTISVQSGLNIRALDTRQTVFVDSSRILGLESGTTGVFEIFVGTVTITNSFIEDETNVVSGAGTVVCRWIASPGAFYTNVCPGE